MSQELNTNKSVCSDMIGSRLRSRFFLGCHATRPQRCVTYQKKRLRRRLYDRRLKNILVLSLCPV